MTLIVLCLVTILFFIAKHTIHDRLSKTVMYLFLLWWGIWLIISTLNVYQLFTVPMTIYLLLILGLFVFLIGYLTAYNKKRDQRHTSLIAHHLVIDKNLLLNIILTLVFLIISFYFVRYLRLRSVLPTDELRMIRFSVGALFTTTRRLLFFNFFIEGFVFFLYPVIAYLLMTKKYATYTFVLSVLSVLFYASIGSGRLPIVYLMISVILAFFMSQWRDEKDSIETPNYHKKVVKASLFSLIFIIPALIIYAAYITSVRLGFSGLSIEGLIVGANELIKQFIIYFTGPFRALNYGIENYAPEIGPLYGQATIAALNELLHATFHLLGAEIRNINYLIGDYLQNRAILVGDNVFMNYSFTYLMIFYFDFGVFGVILFSFMFGFFSRKVIFLFDDTKSLPSFILLNLMFLSMIISIFNWLIQSPSVMIAIIATLIWHYSIKQEKIVVINSEKEKVGSIHEYITH